MITIGIDPGLSGAIGLVRDDMALSVWDMPIAGDGRSKRVSAHLLADLLRECMDMGLAGEPVSVLLERVGAMPGQGTASMFRFGESCGTAAGVVGGLGLSLRYVAPAVWKRRAGLIGKPKDASRAMAIDLFPEIASSLARKKDNGRADALLIAFFGRSAL
jgi:crossover junction endodeoxyribonuclease RuvC